MKKYVSNSEWFVVTAFMRSLARLHSNDPMNRVTTSLRCLLLMMAPLVLLTSGCGGPDVEESQRSKQDAIAIEVELAPIERMQITSSLDLVGTLLPIRATTIVSDVDGVIESFSDSNRILQYEEGGQIHSRTLGLDLGHAVRKGDVLATIDPTDFQLALGVAKAQHDLANRNLEQLLSWKRPEEVERFKWAFAELEAVHNQAAADLQRAKPLLEKGVISQGEYDRVATTERTSAADMYQAKADLNLSEAGPTEEELAVANARVAAANALVELQQEKLDKTEIRAPYDAVIAERYVSVGDRVTAMPRVEIMQLIDPRVLFAQVQIPEKHQRHVQLGDVALVTAAGLPKPIPARIELINSKVDPETRTFRARLAIDNRQGILKAGGFVNAALPVTTPAAVSVVPLEAVSFSDGHPVVYVYREGRVEVTPVVLGISNGRQQAIFGELAPGEMVAADKTAQLADGMPIRPKGAPKQETTAAVSPKNRAPKSDLSMNRPTETPTEAGR